MHNKSIFISLMIGLLLAGSGLAQSTPSIVGTWETVIPPSEGNPRPSFDAMLTFFADGNMVEVNSGNPATSAPGRGVWTGSGNSFLLTFLLFNFDEKGKYAGKIKTYLSITMDGPNRFTCTFTADLIDLAGKVTKKAVYGICKSTRLEVGQP